MTMASKAVGAELADEANPGQEDSSTCGTQMGGCCRALCAARALRTARLRCASVMRVTSN